ncbi:MAG: hypothetical protein ACYDCK_11140 [Thermoplasmatota archaeon]
MTLKRLVLVAGLGAVVVPTYALVFRPRVTVVPHLAGWEWGIFVLFVALLVRLALVPPPAPAKPLGARHVPTRVPVVDPDFESARQLFARYVSRGGGRDAVAARVAARLAQIDARSSGDDGARRAALEARVEAALPTGTRARDAERREAALLALLASRGHSP